MNKAEWVLGNCKFAALRHWNIKGIAEHALEMLREWEKEREEETGESRDLDEAWMDLDSDVLYRIGLTLMSRENDRKVVDVVLERVKEEVEGMLARMPEPPIPAPPSPSAPPPRP